MSVMKNNLFTAINNRLSALGHVLTPGEVFMLVGSVETQIAANASAQADAIADLAGWPEPPTVTGQ